MCVSIHRRHILQDHNRDCRRESEKGDNEKCVADEQATTTSQLKIGNSHLPVTTEATVVARVVVIVVAAISAVVAAVVRVVTIVVVAIVVVTSLKTKTSTNFEIPFGMSVERHDGSKPAAGCIAEKKTL